MVFEGVRWYLLLVSLQSATKTDERHRNFLIIAEQFPCSKKIVININDKLHFPQQNLSFLAIQVEVKYNLLENFERLK